MRKEWVTLRGHHPRTESWTSHLFKGFFTHTIPRTVWQRPYRQSGSIKIQTAHLLSSLSPPVTPLSFFFSQSSFFSLMHLFSNLSRHSSAPISGPFTVVVSHNNTGAGGCRMARVSICKSLSFSLFSRSSCLLLFSFVPGCWANPGPADRHGGERGHSGSHPRRERRGGPDRHLRGHLRVSHTTVLRSMARGDSVEQNANSLTSSRVRKAFMTINWRSLMKYREAAFFSSCVFPCNLLTSLPTRCRNVEMFTENLKKTMILQNQLWSFWCFHHQKGPGPPQNTQGLVSIQGGCCLCWPSSCHFISTHACLHQLWKIVELFGGQDTWLTLKNPWGFVEAQTTRSVVPFLVVPSHSGLQWKVDLAEDSYSWFWLIWFPVTLHDSVHTCLPALSLVFIFFPQLVFILL